MKRALEKSGKDLKLIAGKGNEKDTLGQKIVYVMDSDLFPFKQAEIYHQFHDGFFPGEQYDEAYHRIKDKAIADGRLKPTGSSIYNISCTLVSCESFSTTLL